MRCCQQGNGEGRSARATPISQHGKAGGGGRGGAGPPDLAGGQICRKGARKFGREAHGRGKLEGSKACDTPQDAFAGGDDLAKAGGHTKARRQQQGVGDIGQPGKQRGQGVAQDGRRFCPLIGGGVIVGGVIVSGSGCGWRCGSGCGWRCGSGCGWRCGFGWRCRCGFGGGVMAVGRGAVRRGVGGCACEMRGGTGFIFFAQENGLLNEREVQRGCKQPRRTASEQGAGQHFKDHDVRRGLVAGKAGRVAHVMGGVMQGGRLGMACNKQQGGTKGGHKQRRDKRAGGGGGTGLGLGIHRFLLAVTPDGGMFLCMAGLLTRGSKPAFRLPNPDFGASGTLEGRSPLTVAGAVGVLSAFAGSPFSHSHFSPYALRVFGHHAALSFDHGRGEVKPHLRRSRAVCDV